MSETLLRYWREDPLLNEHHEHWHLVYPYEGKIERKRYTKGEQEQIWLGESTPDLRLWNERHGELFVYMHSQMLARYAAERLSLGLPPVVPLDDYRQPILEGYDPGPDWWFRLDNNVVQAGVRPDNTRLNDITNCRWRNRPGAQIIAQEEFRDRLLAAVSSPAGGNRPATLSELGERIEPTGRWQTPYFGALHNDGHLLISMHDDNPDKPGCMFWEASAIRDPVFYRWHAHIDGFFRKYQDALAPYDFSDLPAVEATGITVIAASGQQNTLTTEMRRRTVRPHNDLKRSKVDVPWPISIEYLSHEDFTYSITALNQAGTDLSVVVRIFMAPEELLDDRRAWIEMDKFRQILPTGATTFTRSSRSSSVIRHPVWTAGMLERLETGPDESGGSPGCRCGWPYTLLLPRGKPEGMAFRFAVLLTPGTDFNSDATDGDNSASYCGLVDEKYPDQRAMGFPFDRRFAAPVREWLMGSIRPPQLASTVVGIKHTGRA